MGWVTFQGPPGKVLFILGRQNLDFCLCTIPTVGPYKKYGEEAGERQPPAALKDTHRTHCRCQHWLPISTAANQREMPPFNLTVATNPTNNPGIVWGAAVGQQRGFGNGNVRVFASAAEWHWWRKGIGSGAGATANADALLGLRCLAWLELLGLLCLACVRAAVAIGASLRHRRLHNSAAKDGEGTAVLDLLGLCWDWAVDASACAALLWPRKNVGGGQKRLHCSAHVAGSPGQSSWGGQRRLLG